jgi:hypothetical protein
MERTEITRNVGGTPGGLYEFCGGLLLAIAGGYLLTAQVVVTTRFWNWWGANTFGLTLVPLFLGIGFLFFNGKSMAGWLLTAGGSVIIVAGILANMHIYFRPTSLFNTLLMLGMLAAGLGLIARSVRAH